MTDVTEKELAAIGRVFLNTICTTLNLGHVSPAESLTYMHPTDSVTRIMEDFVAWTSGQEAKVPGCRERLEWLVNTSGWNNMGLEHILDGLDLVKKKRNAA